MGNIEVDPNDTKGLLSWDWVTERLNLLRQFRVRPDGRPHAMPIWCVWYNGTFYFSTGTKSRKYKNLSANPQAVIHLESGAETVIFEGTVEEISPEPASFEPFADVYETKYPGYRPEVNPDEIYYRLVPRTVIAWTEESFPGSSTRWQYS